MTEEQQGRTTPEAEAHTPTSDEAPEQASGAVAVADEPTTPEATDESQAAELIERADMEMMARKTDKLSIAD